MPATFDPMVSEWGNPSCSNTRYPDTRKDIGRVTWGTETSQYPKEKKTTVILLVAVSETGIVQRSNFRPVVGFRFILTELIEEDSGMNRQRG